MKRITLPKLAAAILAVCLTLGLMPMQAYSATDLSNHWAKSYMEKLAAQNVISGYEDGSVRPDLPITRAEFITMINRVFGFIEKANNRFADISTDNWFLPEIQKAVKAGYITGYDGYARPNAPITREEASVAIYKAFDLPAGQAGALAFIDRDKISLWARDAVASLVEFKYISGYPDGSFNPQGQMTRAEASTIISRFAGEIYSKSGTYNGKSATVKGNVIINTYDITLTDLKIDGDLYIAPGVDEGTVTLENVVVTGNTNVYGGGINSLHIKNSKLGKVNIDKKNGKPVRLLFYGDAEAKEVRVRTDATISTDNLSRGRGGIENLFVPGDARKNINLILSGEFKRVELIGDSIVNLLKGVIKDMLVQGESRSSINTKLGAIISNLQSNSNIMINGKNLPAGLLAMINAINEIKIINATPAPTTPPTPVPTLPPYTGGLSTGSPGTGSTFIPVSGINFDIITYVTGAAVTANLETVDVVSNVVVTPSDATNKAIKWTFVAPANVGVASVTLDGTELTPEMDSSIAPEQGILKLVATINNGSISGAYKRIFLIDYYIGIIVPISVTSVSVSPATVTLPETGGTQQFNATVTGIGNPAQTVTWSIAGANLNAGTTISPQGLLTVNAADAGKTITVTATSTFDKTKSGTATVTVSAVVVRVTGVSVVNPPAKIDYTDGDPLELTGLVVMLTMSDGSTENVAYADFASKGLTVSPIDGTVLDTTNTNVTISHTVTGQTAVQDITVNPYVAPSYILKVVSVPGTGQSNITLHLNAVSNPAVADNFYVKCDNSGAGNPTPTLGNGSNNTYSVNDAYFTDTRYTNHIISLDNINWFSVTISK